MTRTDIYIIALLFVGLMLAATGEFWTYERIGM